MIGRPRLRNAMSLIHTGHARGSACGSLSKILFLKWPLRKAASLKIFSEARRAPSEQSSYPGKPVLSFEENGAGFRAR